MDALSEPGFGLGVINYRLGHSHRSKHGEILGDLTDIPSPARAKRSRPQSTVLCHGPLSYGPLSYKGPCWLKINVLGFDFLHSTEFQPPAGKRSALPMTSQSGWYSKLFRPLAGRALRGNLHSARGSGEQVPGEDGATNDVKLCVHAAPHKAQDRGSNADASTMCVVGAQCSDEGDACQIGQSQGELLGIDWDQTSDSSRGEICQKDSTAGLTSCWGRLAGAGECCRQKLDTRSICELRVRMHVMRLIHER